MRFPVALLFNLENNDYHVRVPDIPGCECRAQTMDDALNKILSIVESQLSLMAENSETIPVASSFESHVSKMEYRSAVWAVVDLDITPYLGKSHKINVTLPELLIKRIDDKVAKSEGHKTRSGFIAAACIEQLNKE